MITLISATSESGAV